MNQQSPPTANMKSDMNYNLMYPGANRIQSNVDGLFDNLSLPPPAAYTSSTEMTKGCGACITTPLLSSLFPDPTISKSVNPQLVQSVYDSCLSSTYPTKLEECDTKINESQTFSSSPQKKRKRSSFNDEKAKVEKIQRQLERDQLERSLKSESKGSDEKLERTSTQHQYARVIPSRLPRTGKIRSKNLSETPSFSRRVMEILSSHSYPTEVVSSLGENSKYYNDPSALQKASFGIAVTSAVHKGDGKKLQSLLTSGLSSNPCNAFGDSVLNNICRRGNYEMFEVVIKCGATFQTVDSFGRTPLHYACWSGNPSFSIIEYIMMLDRDMLRAGDKMGKTPLDFVSEDKAEDFYSFFLENCNKFWPISDKSSCSSLPAKKGVSIPDPYNALPESVAKKVSSGAMSLEELRSSTFLKNKD